MAVNPILLLKVVSVSIIEQVAEVAADIEPRILFLINGVQQQKLLHLVHNVRTLKIINGGGEPQADGDAGGEDGNAEQGGDNRILLLEIKSVSQFLQPLQPPENNFLYLHAENQIVYTQLRGLDGTVKTIHLVVQQGNEEIKGATLWSKSQDIASIIFKIGLPIALGIGLSQMSWALKSQAQITGRAPAIGDGNNAAAGDSDDFTPLIEKLKKQIKNDEDFQKKNFEDARKHAGQKVTAAVLNVMGACICALYNGLKGKVFPAADPN